MSAPQSQQGTAAGVSGTPGMTLPAVPGDTREHTQRGTLAFMYTYAHTCMENTFMHTDRYILNLHIDTQAHTWAQCTYIQTHVCTHAHACRYTRTHMHTPFVLYNNYL